MLAEVAVANQVLRLPTAVHSHGAVLPPVHGRKVGFLSSSVRPMAHDPSSPSKLLVPEISCQ